MPTNNSVNTYIISQTTYEVAMPLQPAFLATKTGNTANLTGDGTPYTVIFDNEFYDLNSDYNTGTGFFTAPVLGIYSFFSSVSLNSVIAFTTLRNVLVFVGAKTLFYDRYDPDVMSDSGNILSMNAYGLIELDPGDTASCKITVFGGTKTVGVNGDGAVSCCFSGFLVY